MMQRAPSANRKPEQVLLSFLGLEPDARCVLRKELVWRGVHFEQLSQQVLLFGDRRRIRDGQKPVLCRDDGLLLLVRPGQIEH